MSELVDGRYELLEVLASGGMATVWRARDHRLDRVVALKRPHPAPADDPGHVRFEREARTAAALSHPHLVTIYDTGRDASGPFLVMELVEGPSLAAGGEPLPPARAVEIGIQLASALAVVHAAGIVHRDIKPANVLMSERGAQLTDFGIAYSSDATSQLTEPGSVIATPSYAAPEVLRGEQPTARSDVFSLAVIIHELLTGTALFAGHDRPFPVPSMGDPHLDDVLRSALAPEPERRPDAAEFEARLRALAPTVTAPLGAGSTQVIDVVAPAEPDRPPAQQMAWLAGAALLVLLALAAVVAFAGGPDDKGGEAAAAATTTSTLPATTAVATTTVPTTTAPTTTVPTTSTDTTSTRPADDPVQAARLALFEALEEVHPSDISPREMRDLTEKVDEAIAAASEGKENEAEKKLEEIGRTVDDKLEGRLRRDVLTALDGLAAALGVELDEPKGDDDDDD